MKYQIKVIISFLIILFLVGYLVYNKDKNKSITEINKFQFYNKRDKAQK
jgi:hypothetical protein